MGDVHVSDEVLASLATKLKALELTDEEAAVLGSVLAAATGDEPEVEGFGVVFEVETTFKGSDEELQAVLRNAVGSVVQMESRKYLGYR